MIAVAVLLLALAAWGATWLALVRATRPGPSIPWATEVAYREHRQCYTGIYSGWEGPPERCAYPEDHYGKCES